MYKEYMCDMSHSGVYVDCAHCNTSAMAASAATAVLYCSVLQCVAVTHSYVGHVTWYIGCLQWYVGWQPIYRLPTYHYIPAAYIPLYTGCLHTGWKPIYRLPTYHCVAVWLRHTAVAVEAGIAEVLQCVAVCCCVLQCATVCCSVLQCVAVCCSVLQCAAVCCSVLQCVAECLPIHGCKASYCRGCGCFYNTHSVSTTHTLCIRDECYDTFFENKPLIIGLFCGK